MVGRRPGGHEKLCLTEIFRRELKTFYFSLHTECTRVNCEMPFGLLTVSAAQIMSVTVTVNVKRLHYEA